MNLHLKYNVILWILVLLYGCAAQKPAPVERSYEEKPVNTKKEVSKCPDVYTVKEGETIFSISIKCAVDYKTLANANGIKKPCLLYTSPSPRDLSTSRMPSSA